MKIPPLICGILSLHCARALRPLNLVKDSYYELQFAIGSQLLSAQVDTASSDIWVSAGPDGFVPSHAFASLGSDFEILYADGTFARGILGQDTVLFEGVPVESVPIAAAELASTNNVFGIGPKFAESCVRWRYVDGELVPDTQAGCVPYDNLPHLLRKSGVIDATVYSIRLDAAQGYLNFGAVDASCQPLTMLPMEKAVYKLYQDGSAIEYSEFTGPLVLLNAISNERRVLYSGAYPLMLDTGSTVSSFPSALIEELRGTVLNFDLRGYEMRVPVEQLRPVANDEENMIVLGQDALQGYQLVFDFDNNEIGIGACREGDAPIPIGVGAGGHVPFAQRAPMYDSIYDYVDPRAAERPQLWTWQAWI